MKFLERPRRQNTEHVLLRGLCTTIPEILRSVQRFCATGILPVLEHGQDGHGTAGSHGQRFFDRGLFSRHYSDHCYKRRRDNNSTSFDIEGKTQGQESTVRGYPPNPRPLIPKFPAEQTSTHQIWYVSFKSS